MSLRVQYLRPVALTCVCFLLLSVFGPQASALEQAGAARSNYSTVSFRGTSNIRTDPSTVAGVGYVHFSQIIFPNTSGPEFIAIGTANGAGTDECVDQYNPKWSVYRDGRANGLYFCRDVLNNHHDAGDVPSFRIDAGTCANGNAGWTVLWNGLAWACTSNGLGAASQTAVALETTGSSTVDRNIDVKYLDLQVFHQGAWVDMAANDLVIYPSYTVTRPSNSRVNAFLGVLN